MPRFLHTCYRIGEIDRSVAFYEKLGFEESGRMPIGDEAINVFMNLPGEDPILDAERFRRTESGICLVTQPMIDRLAETQ